MSGHQPFSNLTANFSSQRKDKIAQQTERLKTEMSLNELKAAYIDQNNDPQFWSEFELWDSTIGDGLDEDY